MTGVCILASYPKSGNTWLRALLTNLLFPGDEPADINHLKIPWGMSRHQLDRLCGIESSWLTDEETELLLPHALAALAGATSNPHFLKTHSGNYPLPDGQPRFPVGTARWVIHLVRHPGAVCRSYANHLGCSIEAAIRVLGDAAHAVRRADLLELPPERVGTWSEHVASWLNYEGEHTLLVRYEDLRDNTLRQLAAIATHCEVPHTHDLLTKAVAFSSLSELKRQEMLKGFRERPARCQSFFGAGRTDGFSNDFTPEQSEKLLAQHGEVMTRLGYLNSDQ